MNKLVRSRPYIEVLRRTKGRRRKLLESFPPFVTADIAEVLHNILLGNVRVSDRQKASLKKGRSKLMDIIQAKRKDRPALIYKQSGGALFTTLLPIIATLIGSIISSRNA